MLTFFKNGLHGYKNPRQLGIGYFYDFSNLLKQVAHREMNGIKSYPVLKVWIIHVYDSQFTKYFTSTSRRSSSCFCGTKLSSDVGFYSEKLLHGRHVGRLWDRQDYIEISGRSSLVLLLQLSRRRSASSYCARHCTYLQPIPCQINVIIAT